MNDIFLKRHSVRSYRSDPVDPKLLETVLEAGLKAPSGCNRQAAEIIVLQSQASRERFKQIFNEVNKRTVDPYYGAPVILLVLARPEGSTYVCDGAVALENMMLEAADIGLGSCWIHHVAEVFETEQGRQYLKDYGLDESLVGIGSLALGHPAAAGREVAVKPGRIHVI